MDIKVIILVSVAFLNFALGASIFFHGAKNLINRRFALFSLGLAVWTFGIMMYATKNPADWQGIYYWSLVLHFMGAFIGHSFFYFSLAYPKEQVFSKRAWQIIFSLPLFITFYYLFIDQAIVIDLNIYPNNRQLIYGGWHLFYFWYFFSYMAGGLIILFAKSFKVEAVLKKQMRTIFFGILFPLIFAGIFNMVLPTWGNFQYAWIGPIFLLIVLVFIAYAIIKQEFLDIKLIATEIFVIFLSLVTLIEIFISQSRTELFLRIIIFAFTLIFATLLIRSVLKEVKRREEIEKLANELSKTGKKLHKANKQLKKLDEAKSEFISIASHQLRTPLTAIKGYGSMLLEGDFGEVKDEKQRGAIEKMFISNDRLISLVENLLNISRIESGRLKFDLQPMQLEVLVKEICDNLQKAAKEKGLYLNFKTIGKIPTVNADDEKIRQVVINFIDNAIKYTKEGGITATVSFVNNKVTCCVQDTGMGVRKEVKSQLFKKFSRGKGAFLVNTEGTGLGLYVAHMMIDSHQGGIWVESEGEGKGSKFCFDLPIGKPNAS